MGTDDALKRIVACAREVRQSGADVQVSVQSAFGCGFEGAVPEERVLGIVRSYIDAGLTNISLADTAGHAHPHQVRRLYARVRELSTEVHCISHFHDTYGLGIANALAALESGAATFETSFAGLGGCPFTKVMAGNIPTEDLVHTFKRLGVPCRADLNRLITIARDVASHFGREMPGRVYKTGQLSY